MKKIMMILVAVMVLLFGASAVSPALAQVYHYPGDPPLVEIPLGELEPANPVFALPDFTITNVVKEFIATSSTGTFYRYFVTVQNYRGPCLNCHVRVQAHIMYLYPDHASDREWKYESVTLPNDGEAVTSSFLINERKRSGYDYPESFLVSFKVDANEAYAELDEDNNTWACDDWIMECDSCGRDTCP